MSHSQEKISVALCTYNGERFLSRQLTSIQQQTRSPDELVVCDDCSTDGTIEMLHDFAASAAFPVRITRNEHNLGFVANFERAIRLCQGDLIALCDQDDIWYPTRLERSLQEFTAHPEVGFVFSDADIIDDQDQLTGMRLWTNFGFVGERKEQLFAGDYTVLAKNRFVTGATVMFRSRLRENCLPIGSGWLHDEWIVAIAAAVAEVRPIDSAADSLPQACVAASWSESSPELSGKESEALERAFQADRPAGRNLQQIVSAIFEPAGRGALFLLPGAFALCPFPLRAS